MIYLGNIGKYRRHLVAILGRKTAGRKIDFLDHIRIYNTQAFLLTGTDKLRTIYPLETRGEYNPKYFDYQTNLNFRISQKWKASFLGNISMNNYSFTPV